MIRGKRTTLRNAILGDTTAKVFSVDVTSALVSVTKSTGFAANLRLVPLALNLDRCGIYIVGY